MKKQEKKAHWMEGPVCPGLEGTAWIQRLEHVVWLEPRRLAGKQWAVCLKVCESQVVAGSRARQGTWVGMEEKRRCPRSY